MPTKFSQFNNGGAIVAGDLLAGLRNGQDFLFTASTIPSNSWVTLLATGPLVANTNYFAANAVPAVYTLPAVFPFGQSITITNIGPSTFTIAQNAGQQIIFGNHQTTLGVAGNLQNGGLGDGLTLVCYQANTGFIVVPGSQGIWAIN